MDGPDDVRLQFDHIDGALLERFVNSFVEDIASKILSTNIHRTHGMNKLVPTFKIHI